MGGMGFGQGAMAWYATEAIPSEPPTYVSTSELAASYTPISELAATYAPVTELPASIEGTN